MILPYVNTPQATHILLAFLLAAHLGANFAAVRGLSMRTLNRQRACIAWSNFRALERGSSDLSIRSQRHNQSLMILVGMNRQWRGGLVASRADLET